MTAEADLRFSAQHSQADDHNGYGESTNSNGSEAGLRRAALRWCAPVRLFLIPVNGGAVAANNLVSYFFLHSYQLESGVPTTMVFRPLVGRPAGNIDVGAVNASG
jgi:hypothetical protein